MKDNNGFDFWKKEVDKIFSNKFGGLISDDFPDYCYMSDFKDGFTPEETFENYIEEYNNNPF